MWKDPQRAILAGESMGKRERGEEPQDESEIMKTRNKCEVKNNRVLLCSTLMKSTNLSGRSGIYVQTLSNIETGQPTRSYVIAKSGIFKTNGIVLNYCPFCGEKIGEHMQRNSKS